MSYGEIYKLTSQTSNKSYIGQAKKYMGIYDSPWGMEKRWKSHVREATCGKTDHCRLLNNAIRKYSQNDFTLTKLCDCESKKDMDEKEKHYINEYNTLVPNGYNLNKGGYCGADSEETKEKKRLANLGRKHTLKARRNMTNAQLGNRRNKKVRKYPEDEDLPKYISARRESGDIVAYNINGFPIGINNKKYINENFSVSKYESQELTLKAAKDYLESLEKKYAYVKEEIAKRKEEETNKIIIATKKDMHIHLLPPYVYAVFDKETKRKIGYRVEGVPDNNGNPYPTKEFIELKTNKWNLWHAKEYIKKCEIKNKDELFKVPTEFETSRKRKYDDENDNNLPKYVSIIREKDGTKIGYNIAIPSITKPNGKRYTRKFANKKLTMEEKLRICIETLNKVKQEYNITN